MGSYIPPQVARTPLLERLLAAGLKLLPQGKVRDTYALPDHPELLLQVASNRISIFDFVLGMLIPQKGEVLTALTILWLTRVLIASHHLVAFGADIDDYMPEGLRGDKELQRCAIVIKRANVIPVEGVIRGYLTGSGWVSYQKDRTICGHVLPEGLHDGIRLTRSILTPTTKAQEGHDTPIPIYEFRETPNAAEIENLCLRSYGDGAHYALGRGLILADTKFELGWILNRLCLVDEVLTPDSSRYWGYDEWMRAQEGKKSPQGYDKQHTRDHGKTIVTPFEVKGQPIIGINNLDTENMEHCRFVGETAFPEEVISFTQERYLELVTRLIKPLEAFQREDMGIAA